MQAIGGFFSFLTSVSELADTVSTLANEARDKLLTTLGVTDVVKTPPAPAPPAPAPAPRAPKPLPRVPTRWQPSQSMTDVLRPTSVASTTSAIGPIPVADDYQRAMRQMNDAVDNQRAQATLLVRPTLADIATFCFPPVVQVRRDVAAKRKRPAFLNVTHDLVALMDYLQSGNVNRNFYYFRLRVRTSDGQVTEIPIRQHNLLTDEDIEFSWGAILVPGPDGRMVKEGSDTVTLETLEMASAVSLVRYPLKKPFRNGGSYFPCALVPTMRRKDAAGKHCFYPKNTFPGTLEEYLTPFLYSDVATDCFTQAIEGNLSHYRAILSTVFNRCGTSEYCKGVYVCSIGSASPGRIFEHALITNLKEAYRTLHGEESPGCPDLMRTIDDFAKLCPMDVVRSEAERIYKDLFPNPLDAGSKWYPMIPNEVNAYMRDQYMKVLAMDIPEATKVLEAIGLHFSFSLVPDMIREQIGALETLRQNHACAQAIRKSPDRRIKLTEIKKICSAHNVGAVIHKLKNKRATNSKTGAPAFDNANEVHMPPGAGPRPPMLYLGLLLDHYFANTARVTLNSYALTKYCYDMQQYHDMDNAECPNISEYCGLVNPKSGEKRGLTEGGRTASVYLIVKELWKKGLLECKSDCQYFDELPYIPRRGFDLDNRIAFPDLTMGVKPLDPDDKDNITRSWPKSCTKKMGKSTVHYPYNVYYADFETYRDVASDGTIRLLPSRAAIVQADVVCPEGLVSPVSYHDAAPSDSKYHIDGLKQLNLPIPKVTYEDIAVYSGQGCVLPLLQYIHRTAYAPPEYDPKEKKFKDTVLSDKHRSPDLNDNKHVLVYFHKLSFDMRQLLKCPELVVTGMTGSPSSVKSLKCLFRGVKIKFRDSASHIRAKLEDFSTMYKLGETSKQVSPYKLYNNDTINRRAVPMEDARAYLSEEKYNELRLSAMCAECLEERDGVEWFLLHKYDAHYCKMDVLTLAQGFSKHRAMLGALGVDVHAYLSVSALAHGILTGAGAYDDVWVCSGLIRQYMKKHTSGGRTMVAIDRFSTRGKARPESENWYDMDCEMSDPDCNSMYAAACLTMKLPKGRPLPLGVELRYYINELGLTTAERMARIREHCPAYNFTVHVTRVGKKHSIPLLNYKRKDGARITTNEPYIPLPEGHEGPMLCNALYLDETSLADIVEHHDIDFSVHHGIYWPTGTEFNTRSGEVMKYLYQMRKDYKAVKNPFQECIKAVLTGSFGYTVVRLFDTKYVFIPGGLDSETVTNFSCNNFNIIAGPLRQMNRNGSYTTMIEVYKPSWEDYNFSIVGTRILTNSKHLMTKLTSCVNDIEDKHGMMICTGTDTDSLNVRAEFLDEIAEAYRSKFKTDEERQADVIGGELFGDELGQFSPDTKPPAGAVKCKIVKLIEVGKKVKYKKLECTDKDGNVWYEDAYRMKGIKEGCLPVYVKQYNEEHEMDGAPLTLEGLYRSFTQGVAHKIDMVKTGGVCMEYTGLNETEMRTSFIRTIHFDRDG